LTSWLSFTERAADGLSLADGGRRQLNRVSSVTKRRSVPFVVWLTRRAKISSSAIAEDNRAPVSLAGIRDRKKLSQRSLQSGLGRQLDALARVA